MTLRDFCLMLTGAFAHRMVVELKSGNFAVAVGALVFAAVAVFASVALDKEPTNG